MLQIQIYEQKEKKNTWIKNDEATPMWLKIGIIRKNVAQFIPETQN